MADERRTQASNQVRQSQIVTTYGPGSMVDLPNHSVIIGGLNHWHGEMKTIREERLQAKVCTLLDRESIELKSPPLEESVEGRKAGITSFVFPQWFLVQIDDTYTDSSGKTYRTRPLVSWHALTGGKYRYPDPRTGKSRDFPVVPVRFVQACPSGHIEDINWYAFVRQDANTDESGQLWLDEGGAGNDFSEIYVRCERTKARRPLADAMVPGTAPLGTCGGRMPWIGPRHRAHCGQPARLLVRSASNSYFSQRLSVIHIPEADAELRQKVDRVYDDFLLVAESVEDIAKERKKPKVAAALEGVSDAEVWSEVRRRKSGAPPEDKSIKQAEAETLFAAKEEVGSDEPQGDFYGRAIPLDNLAPEFRQKVNRLVLVHRLREVVAQVGFTRFESIGTDDQGELGIGVRLAPLSDEAEWLPAYENRGEGIFIGFAEAELQKWAERPKVVERGEQLDEAFKYWCKQKDLRGLAFRGVKYVMLHTLSHLLLTSISLECGYSASSIRERVYAGAGGFGILLYTGSPGAEGTLGGLVDVGHDLERHLRQALELGRLCSNDPVCSEHDPRSTHTERYLNGAACHGCLYLAETSCEARNEYLDRALVVPTIIGAEAAFFGDEA
jgi:hypothetical protein